MDSIKHHILKQSSKYLIFGLTSVDFYHPYTDLDVPVMQKFWHESRNESTKKACMHNKLLDKAKSGKTNLQQIHKTFCRLLDDQLYLTVTAKPTVRLLIMENISTIGLL